MTPQIYIEANEFYHAAFRKVWQLWLAISLAVIAADLSSTSVAGFYTSVRAAMYERTFIIRLDQILSFPVAVNTCHGVGPDGRVTCIRANDPR